VHPARRVQDHGLKNRSFRGVWLPVGAYLVLIFGLSSIPHLAPPGDIANSDKIAHFSEYAILGLLLFRALSAGGRSRTRAGWMAVLIGSVIAVLDELYQGTVGRDRSAGDWAADTAGLAVAVLAWITRERRRRS
jgi:VanZ family protein